MPKCINARKPKLVVPSTIISQTKARFEALLKLSLRTKQANSKHINTDIQPVEELFEYKSYISRNRKRINHPVSHFTIKKTAKSTYLIPIRTNRHMSNKQMSSNRFENEAPLGVFKEPPVPLTRKLISRPFPRNDLSTGFNSVHKPDVPNMQPSTEIQHISVNSLQPELENRQVDTAQDDSSHSSGTFNMEKPKHISANQSNPSSPSTYNVSPKPRRTSHKEGDNNSDTTSNGTYNIKCESFSSGSTPEKRNRKLVTVKGRFSSPASYVCTPKSNTGGLKLTVGDIIVHKSPTLSTSESTNVIKKSADQRSPSIRGIESSDDDQDVCASNVWKAEKIVNTFLHNDNAQIENQNSNGDSKIVIEDLDEEGDQPRPTIDAAHMYSDSDNDQKDVEVKLQKRERKKWKKPSDIAQYHITQEVKPKRKHKKRSQQQVTEEPTAIPSITYENIIGITIHKTDYIEINSFILHPMVKMHIIDSETGEYLLKSDPNRPVCFFYENKDITYITPLMTKEFNIQEKRSLIPYWEEELILNEDYDYLVTNLNLIIFFEIVDFVSFSTASIRYKSSGVNGGWHQIAWAFLKLMGKNGASNVEQKLRLQLYKPGKSSNRTSLKCDVFEWWKKKRYEKYPATLYVSVHKVVPSYNTPQVMRSRNPMQEEYSATTETPARFGVEKANSKTPTPSLIPKEMDVLPWSRLESQICKIPNQLRDQFAVGRKGCFTIRFSNDGNYLACATVDSAAFDISIYQITPGNEILTLHAHQGLVYALDWLTDDKFLLSASADHAVYIWDVHNKLPIPVHMLPHPGFVYCAEFRRNYAGGDVLVATGCFDGVVRVWSSRIMNNSSIFELAQECEEHDDFITSLTFDQSAEHLYTADNQGRIFQWSMSSDGILTWKREYSVRDLKHIPVNSIHCHPGGQRLLIHARDGVLRMFDIATGCVMQWFHGVSHPVQTRCCLSPCGRWIFAPNDVGTVNIWNSDTGRLESSYDLTSLGLGTQLIHCLHYHPHEHIVALSHYGHSYPVVLLKHGAIADNMLVNESTPRKEISENRDDVALPMLPTELPELPLPSVKPTLEHIIEKMDEVINPNINKHGL